MGIESELKGLQCGVMVGQVSATTASIWTLPAPGQTVEVRFRSDGGDERSATGSSPAASSTPAPAVVDLTQLTANTRYSYRVFVDGETTDHQSGSFSTSPDHGSRSRFTFAVSSCMKRSGKRWNGRDRKQKAWRTLVNKDPRFQILLGDNAYSNSFKPTRQWERHIQQRNVARYADAVRRVPTFATWDDHDFGPNNSAGDTDKNRPHRDSSLSVFRDLWPLPGPGSTAPAGAMSRWSFGDVDFFLLDVRYHRDNRSAILGDAQLGWLRRELETSNARLKFIGAGSALTNGGNGWSVAEDERRQLVNTLLEHGPSIFLSGDVHKCKLWPAEARRVAPIYEFISSGIGRKRVNPKKKTRRFVTVDVNTLLDDPTVTATIWNRKGDERGSLTVRASEIPRDWP